MHGWQEGSKQMKKKTDENEKKKASTLLDGYRCHP